MIDFLKTFKCRRRVSSPKKNKKSEDQYMPSQIEIWKFYLKFLKIDWMKFCFIQFNWLVTTFITTKITFVLLDIKNHLVNNDAQSLKSKIIEFIIYQLTLQLMNFLEVKYFDHVYQETKQSIQRQILQHLFSLDIQYFEDNKVTTITKIVQQGASQITHEVSYGRITGQISTFINRFGELYFVYCQSYSILILMLVFGFISSFVIQFIEFKKEIADKNEDSQSDFHDFALDDIISNIHIIKTFNAEKKEIESLNKIIKQNAVYQQKSEYYNSIKNIISNSSNEMLKIFIIIWILISMVDQPENQKQIANSLAEIMTTLYSAFRITNNLIKYLISKQNNYYEKSVKSIGKVMKLFNLKPSIQIFDDDQSFELLKGNIKFESVSFKYPVSNDILARMNQKQKQNNGQSDSEDETESNSTVTSSNQLQDNSQSENDLKVNLEAHENGISRSYVLKNISFSIKQGQLAAFVGMSGSGKSTIVKLLERYYDIQEGNILFDNKNIKDISLNSLRGSIGLVSQEPSLFDNDIEYNISYGCRNGEYTQEELKQICDASGVSEFVFDKERFPEGLKTLVGSKGVKLSGGQKQRVAIARALIKKPSILILDEATSSLDAESEHLVQKYIDNLVGFRGLTIIVVAHRLSTIAKSDIIFVMENGEIKEQGTHKSLLAQECLYKRLIHHQIQFQRDVQND